MMDLIFYLMIIIAISGLIINSFFIGRRYQLSKSAKMSEEELEEYLLKKGYKPNTDAWNKFIEGYNFEGTKPVNEKKYVSHQTIGVFCKAFFYHWYNQSGTNTEQGFNDWTKTEEFKKLKDDCNIR